MYDAGEQQDVMSRYLAGPALLQRTVADLSDADLDAPPSSGGWTVRQIVHHVGRIVDLLRDRGRA